jgi:hypothetical protein
LKKLLSIAFSVLFFTGLTCVPVSAEDGVGVTVEVSSTEGAPEIRANSVVPFGKKSDAAIIKFSISGLEPNRDVFFVVAPLLDPFARGVSDNDGNLSIKLELPYGLEPGRHEILAQTFFSTDDIPVSYTIGQVYVSDFGILTKADGTSPVGTEPAEILLPYSDQNFKTAPVYSSPKGVLRVSDPQLRVTQAWLPIVDVGLSFNNDTSTTAVFSAKVTLETFFGSKVGETFFVDIKSLGAGETQSVLLKCENLPPVGFFNIRTELLLPNDFAASVPIETTISKSVFIVPILFWLGIALILIAGVFVQKRLRHIRMTRNLQIGGLA